MGTRKNAKLNFAESKADGFRKQSKWLMDSELKIFKR
jgi:hypothetical protein